MYTYIIYLTNNLSKAIFMKLRKLFSRITLSRMVVSMYVLVVEFLSRVCQKMFLFLNLLRKENLSEFDFRLFFWLFDFKASHWSFKISWLFFQSTFLFKRNQIFPQIYVSKWTTLIYSKSRLKTSQSV